MSEISNFSSRVEEAKMERIWNLKDVFNKGRDYWVKEMSTDDIMEFFQKKWVNPDSLRNFLDKHVPEINSPAFNKTSIIEWLITGLSLNEWKQEIISEILKQWPFKDPEDLAFVIAKYIQSKMPYDGISALRQFHDALSGSSGVDNYGQMSFSEKSPDDIINVLRQAWIRLPDETIEKLKKSNDIKTDAQRLLVEWIQQKNVVINEVHMKHFRELFQKLREKGIDNLFKDPAVMELEKIINNNDVKWFSDYIFQNFQDNNQEFMMLFSWLWGEALEYVPNIEMLWNQTEIKAMLKEVKTGVCRHYSIIMRELFNEIVRNGEGIEFDWKNTEMVYVLNQWQAHAYNVLLTEWKNWELQKSYLDVTRFIMGDNLFSDQKIPESRKYEEVWASAQKIDHNLV